MASGNGAVTTTISFVAQIARYIRVTQTASAPANWWSIAEFNVFGKNGALPDAPTGLNAVAASGQVSLAWNSAFGATGYNVKQAAVPGGPYVVVATNLPSPGYVATGLANGAVYYFVVSGTNPAGAGADSAEVSATPSPTILAISAPRDNQATLMWPTNVPMNLYHTSALSPAAWALVANPPAVSNGLWWVTVPLGTNNSGYYRLQP
jgi:hypothetical protein